MKALVAGVLSFLLLVAGIALCMYTDLALKTRDDLPKSVDVHSWDITGTIMIGVGLTLLVLSVISLIDFDDDKKEVPNEQPRNETLVRWP